MANPYLIEGPALLSFSGGRTSAKMVKRILDAHGGTLPSDIHVAFANTGKERPETLRFVHECGVRWGVHIVWLEWRSRLKRTPLAERFEIVGLNSASRNGEPFRALIESKSSTPNAVARWCTEHLKMQVLADFMESLGYVHWTNVVGLRADEIRRVAKKDRQNEEGLNAWTSVMPLVRAGVRKADVARFWLGENVDPKVLTHPLPQGFDLGLYNYEGNCDLCFLKAYKLLCQIERENPRSADWWKDAEIAGNGTFVTEYSYAQMQHDAVAQPKMSGLTNDEDYDAECGVGGVDHRIRCGERRAA